MKTSLNFENNDTKKLLSELDFEFFLKENIAKENYNQVDIDTIYETYKKVKTDIRIRAKADKKQFFYYMEGQVRKMFTGGLLPAHFQLDEGKKLTIFDFPAVGENWAYFDYWQKYQRRKVITEKIWDITIKTGSILAILLSIIKFIEYINQYGLEHIFK